MAAEDASGGNALDWLFGEGANVLCAELGNGGDKDGGRDISRMSTALATLSAYQICADVDGFLDVLGVADHVHVENSIGMELLDDSLGWDTDSADKEARSTLDDDIDQLAELSLGVIVAIFRLIKSVCLYIFVCVSRNHKYLWGSLC